MFFSFSLEFDMTVMRMKIGMLSIAAAAVLTLVGCAQPGTYNQQGMGGMSGMSGMSGMGGMDNCIQWTRNSQGVIQCSKLATPKK